MKIKYNRFALLPHTCIKCEKTFWLEPYKRYKMERLSIVGCVEYLTNICKECDKALEQMEDTQERSDKE